MCPCQSDGLTFLKLGTQALFYMLNIYPCESFLVVKWKFWEKSSTFFQIFLWSTCFMDVPDNRNFDQTKNGQAMQEWKHLKRASKQFLAITSQFQKVPDPWNRTFYYKSTPSVVVDGSINGIPASIPISAQLKLPGTTSPTGGAQAHSNTIYCKTMTWLSCSPNHLGTLISRPLVVETGRLLGPTVCMGCEYLS